MFNHRFTHRAGRQDRSRVPPGEPLPSGAHDASRPSAFLKLALSFERWLMETLMHIVAVGLFLCFFALARQTGSELVTGSVILVFVLGSLYHRFIGFSLPRRFVARQER